MSDANIEIRLGMNAAEVEAALARLAQVSEQRISQLQRTAAPGAAGANVAVSRQFGSELGQVQAGIRSSAIPPAEQTRLIAQLQRQYRTPFLQAAQGAPGAGATREELLRTQKETELSERTRFGLTQATTREIQKQAVEAGKYYQITQRLQRSFHGQSSEVDRFRSLNQSLQQTFATRQYVNDQASEAIARRRQQALIDAEVRRRTLEDRTLSRTQQLQVRSGFLFGRQNLEGLPPTLGQIAGQSLATVGRFAVSGALFYGVTKGISDTVKTAQELEYTFSILDSQVSALDQAGELPQFKQSLFDIARNTGLATDAVAKLGIAFVGAFGNLQAGSAATEIASQIAVVAQLDPGEVFNDLIAGVKAFAATPAPEDQIATLKEIGDLSIQLRNTTGVAPKEIIDFLGRVGPIARTTGLDLKEAAAAAATLLQGSSVGGAALGEQFGRILTGFSENAAEIAQVAQDFPQIGVSIREALSGDPSVLFKLAEGFRDLSQAQQQQIIQQVGSRREGQTLAILFQNSATLSRATAQAETAEGRVAAELEKRKKTLALQVQQLTTALQQLGLALYNAGIGDLLKDLVGIVKAFAGVLELLSRVLDVLPDQLVSFASKAALAYGAFKAFTLLGQGTAAGGASVLGGALAGPGGFLVGEGAAAAGGAGAGGLSGLIAGAAPYAAVGIPLAIGATKILHSLRADNTGSLGRLRARVEELRTIADEVDKGVKSDLDQLVQDAGGSIKNVPTADLQSLAPKPRSFLDRFLNGDVTRPNKQQKQAQQELERRRIDRQARLLAFLRDQGIIDEEAQKSLTALLAGSRDPDAVIERFLKTGEGYDRTLIHGKVDVGKIKQLGPKVIERSARREQKAKEKLTAEQQSVQEFNDALASYDAGEISLAQLWESYLRKREVLDQAPAGTAAAKDRDKVIAEANKRHDAALRQAFDLQKSVAELGGGGNPQDNINRLRVLRSQTLDPDEQVKIAQEIAEEQKALLQDMADKAATSEEAARILREGIPIDVAVRTDLIRAQLQATGGAFQLFIAKYLGTGFEITTTMANQIAQFIIQGQTAIQALRSVLISQVNNLDLEFNPSNLTDALGALPTNVPDPTLGVIDPTKVTNPAKDDAKKQADAAKEIAQARLEYLAALVENDPVASAQIAQRQADLAVQQATNEAEKIRAQIQRIKADRQLQEAIQEIAQSQIDLAIAFANAAGDTVEAAHLATQKAQQNLAYLRTHGAGEAALNNAQAQVVSSQAAERDAILSDQQSKADFQRQMDLITDSQYKNLLEQMLLIPDLTEKQRQDIQLKIHDLQKSLGKDYQFNLPTELGLPTLYEARRLDQTGGGYNDNRQVTVNVYPSQGMDESALAAAVVQQFNQAPRTGLTPRLY